ncbi:CHAT domain-containing protein [Allorhizocola rhizosphaerae]|uniref:CHAT domain-containing protein n=1 Tax=Allorhizocola rhizosphaerae TaxID=1872709 RepID=UPI000E3C1927|nr:CHAT domain-containing protein [Allorhizocola rhizosphaerae]
MTVEQYDATQRCRVAVQRALAGDGGADLQAAVEEVLGLPVDHTHRARWAADLIAAFIMRPFDSIHSYLGRMGELLDAADRDPPLTPEWTGQRFVAQAMSLMYDAGFGPVEGLDAVRVAARRLAEQVADPRVTGLVQAIETLVATRLAFEQGNESAIQKLPEMAASLGEAFADDPRVAELRQLLVHGAQAFAANQRGDVASAMREFGRLQELIGGLSPEHPMANLLSQSALPLASLSRYVGEDGVLAAAHTTNEELEAIAGLSELHGVGPVVGGLTAGMASLGLGTETDPGRIEQGIAHLRESVAATPPGHPQRAICLASLALGLFRRSENLGTTEGLAEAKVLLEEARDLLGSPQHPQWSFVNDLLSGIRQRSGDFSGIWEAGIAAQRGYAWRVLLETDIGGAQVSVRSAAKDAVDIARRCITYGDPGDALRALDFGRGLMLSAATHLHRIPARLEAAGHADLAHLWSQNGTPPEDLRRRVLEVLTNQSGTDLLDPPALQEIQSALARLEADALVYLVPMGPPHGGLAVMMPAVGPPAFMPLPHLDLGEGTDVERYLSTLSTRDSVDSVRDLPAEDDQELAYRLDALCDWAWRVAMGPLLEGYLPSLPARPDGLVPRIVLIAMGDLARVPWHAARRKDGVYAVQLAAISQAVSARLLCDNAALPPVSLNSTGLIVADPDTGKRGSPLRSARLEAYAVRRSFYRAARYLGRRPEDRQNASGAGTAEEVRTWLRNRSPAAGAMLHLACHGYFKTGSQAVAHLLLAGEGKDDASELSVVELVDLLAATPDRVIGLVVLAACNSGRAVYGYDEAYSLGTGFLAGGVRSVLSTQWSVPDVATSWLMYLFHHFLRHDGLPPWKALREAQMWMLDPARTVPTGMPEELVPGPNDDPAHVLNWAGFIHYGQ